MTYFAFKGTEIRFKSHCRQEVDRLSSPPSNRVAELGVPVVLVNAALI